MGQQKKVPISTWKLLRNRVLAGLFVVLPIFITYFIIRWLYESLSNLLIGPISNWFLATWYPDAKNHTFFVENIVAPGAALGLVLGLLFIAGMFFRSRIHHTLDWFLNNVPIINLVYSVVHNVIDGIQRSQFGAEEFKRVVLVPFPHPGMKAPAFVTSETKDETTGANILCVYVPTTPVPTSGYMLLIPESDVVPLDWDLQETLQAIVSGGITTPGNVHYHPVVDIAQTSTTATVEDVEKPKTQTDKN